MVVSRLLPCRGIRGVILVVLLSLSTAEAANPLARFFMMGNGNKGMQGGGGGGGAGAGGDIAGELSTALVPGQCVDPRVYTEQTDALRAQGDEFKQQYEAAAAELAREQLNSKRLSEVKEDLLNQMAKLSSSTSKELATAKQELAVAKEDLKVKRATIEELRTKLHDTVEIKDILAEQRVRETENLYKIELDLVKASAQLEVENAQQLADRKCNEKIQEKLAMVTAGEPSSDEHGSNSVGRVKIKVLQEENAALHKQKETLQQHLASLESKYSAKYSEKEQQMRDFLGNSTQEKAEEICSSKIEALQAASERELSAAMALCEEEAEIKLQKAEEEADEHLEKVEERHGQRMAELTEECLEQIKELKEVNELELELALEARQLQFDASKGHFKREQTALLDQINNLTLTLAESRQHSTDLASRAEQQELRWMENEAIANKTCQTKISDLEHSNMECKSRYDEKVEALKESNQSHAAMNETAKALEEDLKTCEERKAKVKAGLEHDLQQTSKSLQTCQTGLAKCQADAAHLKKQVEEKRKEAEYWSTVFVRRSSFNWTHAEEAVLDWAAEATNESNAFFSEQYQALERAIEPHARPIHVWYNERLRQHVNPVMVAVGKHYSQHASPHVQEVKKAMQGGVAIVKAYCQSSFQSVVSDIRRVFCPSLQKRANKSTPQFVKENIHAICQDPARSLVRSLYMTALVLVLVFRRQLVRLFLRCVCLAWHLVRGSAVLAAKSLWFLCPIRLLIPKSKKQPKSGQTTKLMKKKSIRNGKPQ